MRCREAGLDVLVNSASVRWVEPIDVYSEAVRDRVFNLNAKKPFFLSQQLLPLTGLDATDLDRPDVRQTLYDLWIDKGLVVFGGLSGRKSISPEPDLRHAGGPSADGPPLRS